MSSFAQFDLSELAKQVPALGVLCFIVWTFLKHMTARDDMIKDIHRENTEERRISRETVKENTVAMNKNTVGMEKLSESIKEQQETSKNLNQGV